MAATKSDADVQAIPTVFDPATCTRRGFCPVTLLKKGASPIESHSLYFEQHGSGPEKMLFIMGCVRNARNLSIASHTYNISLNSTSFTGYQQVEYFGRKPEYSILVFDNRGIGNSGIPMGPYKYVY
ncbi:hypothetical protein SCP_0305830 [Sparassis crispa]|uniref:AB hydrolase-1 domain-containing protein n=1 Tax=Sparassis crispa TaxID=139825 RepID=A0A401GFI6_9APHY|nr:hypothetical protein SCP_0305830 [Sparassis crispa]GBE80863.1 hypothetical protein SCP_0305830 [Sparassis crispa]